MPYLHYTYSEESLHAVLKRAYHNWHITELQLDDIVRDLRRTTNPDTRAAMALERNTLIARCRRFEAQTADLEEEIDWRTDPDAVTACYAKTGYKPIYLCGHYEFSTPDGALAEAHYIHHRNDVMRELGPDGSWDDDLVPPEEMIWVQFVPDDYTPLGHTKGE